MEVRIARLEKSSLGDFFSIHCEENGEGWCNCVAWWVPTWEGWDRRTAEENRNLRRELFDRGEYDGYLLYVGERPAAWCQVGTRDRLVKLVRQYGLSPDPEVWAVTCFVVLEAHRRQGLSKRLLQGVLADLVQRGVRTVQAFPRRGSKDPGEQWTGPESIFLAAGFRVIRDHPSSPVMELALPPPPDVPPGNRR